MIHIYQLQTGNHPRIKHIWFFTHAAIFIAFISWILCTILQCLSSYICSIFITHILIKSINVNILCNPPRIPFRSELLQFTSGDVWPEKSDQCQPTSAKFMILVCEWPQQWATGSHGNTGCPRLTGGLFCQIRDINIIFILCIVGYFFRNDITNRVVWPKWITMETSGAHLNWGKKHLHVTSSPTRHGFLLKRCRTF